MKLQLSFDKNSAKEFLLEHVEKLLSAGVIVAFLALVAGAFSVEHYGRDPGDLEQSADRAAGAMDRIPAVSDRPTVPFAEMIVNYRLPREDDYRHSHPWDQPLVNPMAPRDEPPVLLVRELRGTADHGAFNMRFPRTGTAAGGRRPTGRDTMESTRGQRWAVVTGLVPAREQREAFDEFFRERIKPNPEPDVPEYIYYRVERAEVEPYGGPSDPNQLNWTALNVRTALAQVENWSSTAPEVVDERFLHPQLVFPLGPKLTNDTHGEEPTRYARAAPPSPWGEEVAHPPTIPVMQHRLGDEMEEPVPDADIRERRPDEPDLDMPMYGDEMGYPGGRPGGRRPVEPRFTDREHGRLRGDELAQEEQEPDHLLFRFFDYSVEAGKSYRYRVRLLLANPNYGIDEKFLADPELAKRRWIEKDRWSEPTPVITIPRDAHVLAGGVHTRLRDTDEPSGTVAIVKWLEETGRDVHKDFRVVRGQQLDYPGTVVHDRSLVRNDEAGDERRPVGGGLLGPAVRDVATEEPAKVDFVTGMLALDLVGGNRLPGRDRSLTEPGRILVMGPDGVLHVLSEARDQREYERRTVREEPPETDPDMPEMFDDMMLLEDEPMRGRRPVPPRRP